MGLGKFKEEIDLYRKDRYKRILKKRIECNYESKLRQEVDILKVEVGKLLRKKEFDNKTMQTFFSYGKGEVTLIDALVKVYETLVHLSEDGDKTPQATTGIILKIIGFTDEQRELEHIIKIGMKLTFTFIESCEMLYLRTEGDGGSTIRFLENQYSLHSLSQIPKRNKKEPAMPLKNKPKDKSIKTLTITKKSVLFRADKNKHSHSVLESASKLEQVGYELNEDVLNELMTNWESKKPRRGNSPEMSKWQSVNRVLKELDKLPSKFYLSTFYDSRGRIYYDSFINPHKSDEIRGLLQYAEGVKLTDRGLEWAFSYLAALYGMDKLSFSERVVEGKKILYADFGQADEPYQFLAFRSEVKKSLQDPNHLFKGRVHLDACASGTQFISALTGDREGLLLTNVLPSHNVKGELIRKDIYQKLADFVKSEFESDLLLGVPDGSLHPADIDFLNFAIKAINEHGRAMGKEVIMTGNYNATKRGIIKGVMGILRDVEPDIELEDEEDVSIYDISDDMRCFTALAMYEAGESVLRGVVALKKHLNKVIGGEVVEWELSDGFVAKNGVKSTKKIKCFLRLNKDTYTAIYNIYSKDEKKNDKRSTRTSLVPNFIHSLDACLLRMVAKRCHFDMSVIHDSFGCHPNNVDKMLQITKECFVEIIESDPIRQLTGESFEPIDEDFSLEGLQESVWFFS
ncbi:DNA-directed RNA polymerase [Carboxylicivirga marina]|uniref:DNA-directed RNA polymerase n=1 Tax=Carboxylicivirga marina TaxID=2800988 RepID=UPI0025963B6E|nr:DNA-directed RNA polymerase [uncultured Carboxylicivirga sp.]